MVYWCEYFCMGMSKHFLIGKPIKYIVTDRFDMRLVKRSLLSTLLLCLNEFTWNVFSAFFQHVSQQISQGGQSLFE